MLTWSWEINRFPANLVHLDHTCPGYVRGNIVGCPACLNAVTTSLAFALIDDHDPAVCAFSLRPAGCGNCFRQLETGNCRGPRSQSFKEVSSVQFLFLHRCTFTPHHDSCVGKSAPAREPISSPRPSQSGQLWQQNLRG